MIRNLSLNKTMWVITALLALSAATLGVFNQGLYEGFFGRAGDSGQTVFYLGLSAVFLLLTVIHLRGLTGKVIEGKRRSVDVIVS